MGQVNQPVPAERFVPDLGVSIAHEGVDVANLHPRLRIAVRRLGTIHEALFNRPLVITSGKDGIHAQKSLHLIGEAFDYRTTDKSVLSNQVFLQVCLWMALNTHLVVFDERAVAAEPHVHVELAG